MIVYDPGHWGIRFIFRLHGSVFPKATVWALPNAALAFVLHIYFHPEENTSGDMEYFAEGHSILWSSYTFVLGFLVVFRNNQAYTRFWEGCTSINQVRGEWFNAISSLISFCSKDPLREAEVENFQNFLVRLGSLMYCSALQQVTEMSCHESLEIIDVIGFSQDSMDFLDAANDRCEIILQWIQRLIIDAEENGTLRVSPPILSRAYQEFSRGIVHLNNVRKIKEIPFPFPYAQMITVMLLVHWAVTPIVAAMEIRTSYGAAFFCFCVAGAFWSLIHIAMEIDQPFGTDANDVPVAAMQVDFNTSLLQLLEPLAQRPPEYKYDPAKGTVMQSRPQSDMRTMRLSGVIPLQAVHDRVPERKADYIKHIQVDTVHSFTPHATFMSEIKDPGGTSLPTVQTVQVSPKADDRGISQSAVQSAVVNTASAAPFKASGGSTKTKTWEQHATSVTPSGASVTTSASSSTPPMPDMILREVSEGGSPEGIRPVNDPPFPGISSARDMSAEMQSPAGSHPGLGTPAAS